MSIKKKAPKKRELENLRTLNRFLSFFLQITAIVPCPTDGTIFFEHNGEIFPLRLRRFNPAIAKTIASYFFSFNFLILVSILPLIDLNLKSFLINFN